GAVLGRVALRDDGPSAPEGRGPAEPLLRGTRRAGRRARASERALRQSLPHILPLLDGLARAADRRRRASLLAAPRFLPSSAAPLGHGAEIRRRLRADRGGSA